MSYDKELFRIGDRVIIDAADGTPHNGECGVIRDYYGSDEWPWTVKFCSDTALDDYDLVSFSTDELVLDASAPTNLSFEDEILKYFADRDPDKVDNTKKHKSGSMDQHMDDWLRDLDDWDIETGTAPSVSTKSTSTKTTGYYNESWYGTGSYGGSFIGWKREDGKQQVGNYHVGQIVRVVPSAAPDRKLKNVYGSRGVIEGISYSGAGEFPYKVKVDGGTSWQMAERELTLWVEPELWVLGRMVETPAGKGRVVKLIPGHNRGDYVVSFATDPMLVYRFEHCKQFDLKDLNFS